VPSTLNLDDYSDEMLRLALRIARAKKTPRETRLKVAFFFLERRFPIARIGDHVDTLRPIQVLIGVMGSAQVAVNGHDVEPADPGSPLRTDGLRLHPDGGNRARLPLPGGSENGA